MTEWVRKGAYKEALHARRDQMSEKYARTKVFLFIG